MYSIEILGNKMEKYEILALFVGTKTTFRVNKLDFNSYAIRHTGANIHRDDEKLRLCRGLKVTVILLHMRPDR